jgi:ubiquinone/menaquinone biosynthesis C-methylase UbiE
MLKFDEDRSCASVVRFIMQKLLAKQLSKPDGWIGRFVAVLMNSINDEMNRLTIERLQLQPSDNILEIGFGNGKYFPEVLRKLISGHLTGLDYSETMVALASKKFRSFVMEGKLTVVQGEVSKIPYQDQTFDKIYTVNTIYFWPYPQKDIREIRRVLKEGGRLLLTFRSREGMHEKEGFTLYSVEEVIELVESAGFREVAVVPASIRSPDIYSVLAVK